MRCQWQNENEDKWRDLSGATFYTECAVCAPLGTINDTGTKAKYVLTKKVRIEAPGYLALAFSAWIVSDGKKVSTERTKTGRWWLMFKPGYVWDGPSFPPNSSTTCVAALTHDGMYTLLRQDRLQPRRQFRKLADRWHRDLLRQFAAGECWAGICYYGLRIFGVSAARSKGMLFTWAVRIIPLVGIALVWTTLVWINHVWINYVRIKLVELVELVELVKGLLPQLSP